MDLAECFRKGLVKKTEINRELSELPLPNILLRLGLLAS